MTENKIIRGNRLLYGGDYNPEQWLEFPDILEKDIEYFKKAHINEVTLGVFAWSMLEPQEEEYQLDWMENILNRMHENGISVILSTPSGARPKWLADKYPEVLRVNENRTKNLFGGRHNHCLTSPVYRKKVKMIDQKLAERFKDHPAVIAWHLSNELGGECHCPLCQKAFQKWLIDKYENIDALNNAWNTRFWSHVYNSFEQIESPSSQGEMLLHGLNLDWKRFVTDQTVSFVEDEKKAIREAGANQPVTINMMYDFLGLNYWKFKDVIDFVSWDNYPSWHKDPEPVTAMDTAIWHDFMRSIKKQPFLLMESCPSSTNWQQVSKLKRPGMLKTASLQALAHGSDSVLYFQIRQSRGASEKFHGAVIDHYGGSDTRVFNEVTEVGQMLEELSGIIGGVTKAKAAIVVDTENRWAMEDSQGPRNIGLHYKEALLKSYMALHSYGIDVDIIDEEEQLDEYVMVVAPMLYLFRNDFEKKAKAFVEKGGKLVMTYWSGIVNETDLCFLGGMPHGLMDVFGLRSEEIDGLYDWESNEGVLTEYAKFAKGRSYKCKNLCELVRTENARALMTYKEDFYAGRAALTENEWGKGKAYYVCADFEEDFYCDFYAYLLNEAGVKPLVNSLPKGVEVTSRETDKERYIFALNYNQNPVKIQLPYGEWETVYGKADGEIKGLDVLVLKQIISD